MHQGVGTRSNLRRLLDEVRRRPGSTCRSLPDLHRFAVSGEAASASASASASVTGQSQTAITRREYDQMNNAQRAAYKRAAFNELASRGLYATSRDFNLRELEVEFIIQEIEHFAERSDRRLRIADLGCGNGYTTLRIAEAVDADIVGIDFADALIDGARELAEDFAGRLRCAPRFELGDITTMPLPPQHFDVVVTERVLLNMTDIAAQAAMLRRIHDLLRPGGIYVLAEGNRDGLRRLNALRVELGLEAIPDREEYQNVGSLKFDEDAFETMIDGLFKTLATRNFGSYFLISRVVHPLLVAPNAPTFDHKINEIARHLQSCRPDLFDGSHLMGRVLLRDD